MILKKLLTLFWFMFFSYKVIRLTFKERATGMAQFDLSEAFG